jgi:hypothetical protein
MDTIRKNDVDFIGIQETKTMIFQDNYLPSLASGKPFCWNWLPSVGNAGGILMGVNMDLFDVENCIIGEFLIICVFVSKRDGFRGRGITTVYGASDEDRKQKFIDELHSIFVNMKEPAIIGGISI